MDEATASIDEMTDSIIQKIIKEDLKNVISDGHDSIRSRSVELNYLTILNDSLDNCDHNCSSTEDDHFV